MGLTTNKIKLLDSLVAEVSYTVNEEHIGMEWRHHDRKLSSDQLSILNL